MTTAGGRVLYRSTTVTCKTTGETITVDNSKIPPDQHQPSHREQRDAALRILGAARDECTFEFSISTPR